MKRVDGFLVLGVPALLAMVGLIVWRARSANDVQPLPAPVSHVQPRPRYRPITSADLRRSRPSSFKTYYAYGEPLPAGYKCSGAGGPVYRVVERAGVSVVDTLTVAGVMVRCGGDERSSYR